MSEGDGASLDPQASAARERPAPAGAPLRGAAGVAAGAGQLRGLRPFVSALAAVLVGLGAYAHAQQLIAGGAATGLRTIGAGGAATGLRTIGAGGVATGLGTIGAGGVAWGLLVVCDAFLLGSALTALAFASLVRIFRLRHLEPAALVATLVGMVGLLLSALCVLADVGRPLHGLRLLATVGRASSPFFGTLTLVVGALVASLVQWLLALRPHLAPGTRAARLLARGWCDTPAEHARRQRADRWLALALVPLLGAGMSIVTKVFVARPGRPAGLAALEMVNFVVLAGASGLGILLVASAAARRAGRLDLPARSVRRLAALMLVLTATGLLLAVLGEILALRSAWPGVRRHAAALRDGDWSRLFWATLTVLAAAAGILLVKLWRRTLTWRWLAAAGALVAAGVLAQRGLLVVAWQTHGLGLPQPAGRYSPTWTELGVGAGILALGVLLFVAALRLLPRAAAAVRVPDVPLRSSRLRRVATAIPLLAGAALAAAGLALSAQLGVERFSDTMVPGSPVLFLAGLVIMASAVVPYELVPEHPRREAASGAQADAARAGGCD